ncbi:hypothetical protein SAMN02745157_4485 [Kaistia soli DSM 19436]|uniref:Uncharacterized protein n=1 Tax=Kaistia soli DSM 19436 TaxID=1122133 RepID=A0A1M5L3W0_9HYPH|nr:hypothetical protein SAMN02745157_4485 [Kaistia soli DSM 19436]
MVLPEYQCVMRIWICAALASGFPSPPKGLWFRTVGVGNLKERGDRYAQCCGDPVKQVDGRIFLLTFETAEVSAVDTGIDCQFLLRELPENAQASKIPRD